MRSQASHAGWRERECDGGTEKHGRYEDVGMHGAVSAARSVVRGCGAWSRMHGEGVGGVGRLRVKGVGGARGIGEAWAGEIGGGGW